MSKTEDLIRGGVIPLKSTLKTINLKEYINIQNHTPPYLSGSLGAARGFSLRMWRSDKVLFPLQTMVMEDHGACKFMGKYYGLLLKSLDN